MISKNIINIQKKYTDISNIKNKLYKTSENEKFNFTYPFNNTIKVYKLKITLIFKNFIKLCLLLKNNFLIYCCKKTNKYFINIIKNNCNEVKNYKTKVKNDKISKTSKILYVNINDIYKNCIYNDIYEFNYMEKQKISENLETHNLNVFSKNINKKNNKNDILKFINNFIKTAKKSIIGQDINIQKIADQLININNKKINKPITNYFLCGPSGTGKTEISKIISDYVYKNNSNLIYKDMTTFTDPSSVSKLIGTPPGYLGHEENSNLVNEILINPNSVVLFDEVEKAHKRIYSVFLQILDEGVLTDSKNTKGYFNKSIIIFTSNLGSTILNNENDGFSLPLSYTKHITEEIKKNFAPEFINRLDSTVIFNPLNIFNLYIIFDKFIKNNHNNVSVDKIVKYLILLFSNSPSKGARFLFKNINFFLLSLNLDSKILLHNNKVCNFLIT